MQPPESTARSLEDINRRLNSMASSLQAMENVVQNMVDHIMQQGGVKSSADISKVLKEELRNLNNKMEDMDVSQSFLSFLFFMLFLIALRMRPITLLDHCIY